MSLSKYYKMYIVITLYSLLLGCKESTQESLYLIPDNYKGTVMIIFNQKNGSPAQYKNDKRLYKIPANGILKTQFKENFGISKFHFYYGKFSVLKYMTPQDWKNYSGDTGKVVCWNLESGVMQDDKNQKINFEVFSVGPIKESEKISDEKGAFIAKALNIIK